MEVLQAETKDFHPLKNSDGPAHSPSASSTVDDDDDDDQDDDRLSHTSTNDEKRPSSKPTESMKSDNEDRASQENNECSNSPSSVNHRTTSTVDYTGHRERLAKELKDYEERWLAHRNFLLYSQSLAMKGEERERFFSQINTPGHLHEENSPLHQLQLQQQLLHRLSKEERDRFFAAALYQQQNPYNFPAYPWTGNAASSSIHSSTPPIISQIQSASDPPAAHAQAKSPSSDDSGNQSNSGSTTEWTFEEQFRQLYELSDEPKRKEFLDDLFAFMQKRGTPVNRIPIMAKHVLDLYELFRLVVGKGGLVEVINKKLWREVTKGLNLPSSITSAAFTLRTQYMKYLYPYECEKLQLSSPTELQAAIEGNRREGRRPSYAFEYSSPPQIMPPPPPPPPATTAPGSAFLSSPVSHRSLDSNHAAMAAALSHPFFLAAAAASSRDMSESLSNTPRMSASSFDEHHPLISSPAMKRSLSPSCHAKSSEDGSKKFSPAMNNHHIGRSLCFTPTMNNTSSLLSQVSKLKMIAKENHHEQASLDKSITLSIELNGTAYQGTLYATAWTGSKE